MKKTRYFERITELRVEKHKTKTEMANVLGIYASAYSKHEKDGRFSLNEIIKLADYHEVSLSYILGFGDERD